MIERSLAVISNQNKRGGLALRNDLRNSFRLERALEKRSLTIKRKLVEDRDRTLKGLLLRSRQEKKDKKGGVGGALGILGGGALGRRFFGRGPSGIGRVPKIPKLPTKGGLSLSRIGKVGRLGRIGPLAVVGTGLDFVGRRAQGQTNLQAGLGAGGGLAGALAGAKYGAILGTAVGGPIGTVIGGIGGSIIGGLAGGRLADLFSGADRRRKFEEQRVEITTQKTLFSSALDDLDRVLDRLEKTPLILKKDDDDGIPRRDSPFAFFGLIRRPKPPKMKFIDRPIVKDIGYTAAFTGLLFLSVLAIGSSPGTPEDAGLILLLRQTVQKSPFLMKIAKNIIKFPKPTPKPEFLKPGVDIPGISPKGIRLRIGDDLFRKLFPNIKFKPKGSPPKIRKIKPDIKKIEERQLNDLLKQEKYLQEQLKKLTNSKTIDEAKRKVIQQFTERLVEVTKQLEGRTIPKKISPNLKPFVRPSTNTNNLRVEAPTNDDDNFIALAPTNNIFLMNQEESNQSTPITEGSDTFLINRGSVSAYDVAINMAQIELLQTV